MSDATTLQQRLPQVHPFDDYNQKLVRNVHPPDWKNPTPADRYHMVIIGAGSAGLVTAAICAGLGARTALIERDLLGGDCLNVGCVPSKALIRCARAAHAARHAETFGVHIDGEVRVDFPAVMERMRRLRAHISPHDSAERFRDLGVDVFLGDGRFTGPDTAQVGDATLRFTRACIATGGRAAAPPIDGLSEAGYLTNETVFSLTELPRRFGVIGGGPIGCELAQAFARFGAEVQLFESSDHVLPREDADAAAVVQESMLRDGVKLHLSAKVKRVAEKDGVKSIELAQDGSTKTIEVDELLVAVGRAPNVENLGLEAAGVEFDDRSGVKIDDRYRTSNKRIFAAGDVCSQYKFTHAAGFMARAVVRNALFFGREKASKLLIPWCTYTEPEIAHVGQYPRELNAQNIEFDTITVELTGNDRAILDGATEGFLKVHVKKGSDVPLGATLVGADAGNLIGEMIVAATHKLGLGKLSSTVHPYPTVGEIMGRAGDEYNRKRLTPFVKKVLGLMLRWHMR